MNSININETKKNKINSLLNDLYKKYGEDSNKTVDSLYYYLTRYLVPVSERKYKTNNLFQGFIDYFKDTSNINVFVSPNWTYFCQFVNYNNANNTNLVNPIKMYFHVGEKDIDNVGKLLFNFLAKNNIKHLSKIGSDIRADDIVIRVYSKEDAIKILKFIDMNPEIKNALRDTNPFCFTNSKVGLSLDGNLSYNYTVASYLYWYIIDIKKENKKPSYESFLLYIENVYRKVFDEKNISDIDLFSKRFNLEYVNHSLEEILNNYQETTHVIIKALKEDNLENYFDEVDFCNNQELINERIGTIKNIKSNSVSNNDIILFQEGIFVMYKKYGLRTLIYNLEDYIAYEKVVCITRDNNLRNRFIKNLPSDKIKRILENKNLLDYVFEVLNNIIVKEYRDSSINDVDIVKWYFDISIIKTYLKYGYNQVVTAVYRTMYDDFSYFTNDDNSRNNLISHLSSEQIKNLIQRYNRGNYLKYISNILEFYQEENYLKFNK